MSGVVFAGATRVFPKAERPAVDHLDLEIGEGELLVLVGPSGCGKSTSLRMLAGLEEIDDGTIHIGDRDVSLLPPKERDIAMVFQSYALYPHMTVAQNMGFALKIAGVPRTEIRQRVGEAAKVLDLEDLLGRKPGQLSGGQRQRVAMGRAIVRKPQVFCMDEPLSNLDAKLRVQTRTQIASLQRRLGVTTVYVTHDQVEAMTMGDRVAVLKDGVLQQVAKPRELYDRPVNVFVAGFIGSPAMNLLPAAVTDGGLRFGNATVALPRAIVERGATLPRRVIVGFRPDSLALLPRTVDGSGFPVVVDVVEETGSDAFVYASFPGHQHDAAVGGHDIVARTDPRAVPAKGETVRLRIREDEMHVFDAATGSRVG
jgi:multiple sugar transport system ATP-binding protein